MYAMTLPYVRAGKTQMSEEETLTIKAEIERMRDELQAQWDMGRAARRGAVESVGGIKDVEAAVDCRCSCHHTAGDLHDQGRTCPCQLTAEERETAYESFWQWSAEEAADHEARVAESERVFSLAAERLGVRVESHGGGAPYVICGEVDGRAFFLRERHDMWRVEIAGDQTPLENPWNSAAADSIVVAEGVSEAFYGENYEVEALELAVSAVRTFIQRRECAHSTTGRWCSECGVLIEEAEKWRIWT